MYPTALWQWRIVTCVTRQCGRRSQGWPSLMAMNSSYHDSRCQPSPIVHGQNVKCSYNFPTWARGFTSTATYGIAEYKRMKSKEEKAREKSTREPGASIPTKDPRLIGPDSTFQEIVVAESLLTNDYWDSVRAENSRVYFSTRELEGANVTEFNNLETRKRSLSRKHGSPLNWAARAKFAATRQKLVEWEENCCAHLAKDFDAIIRIRAKIARLSGVKNYMELKQRSKMLNANSADAFLTSIQHEIAPFVKSQREEMLKMKLRDDGCFNLGDAIHYSTRVLAERDLSSGNRPNFYQYFPTWTTSRRLLATMGKVFGIEFIEISPEQPAYENVLRGYKETPWASPTQDQDKAKRPLLFAARNTRDVPKPGADLGYLVLDLIHSAGKGRSSLCIQFNTYSKDMDDNGMRMVLPEINVALVSNIEPASPTEPSLLSHADVRTLAHELGHGIHRLVRKNLIGCPWDSIEIPSYLLEYWVLVPEILQRLSSHYIYEDPKYMLHWRRSNRDAPLPPERAPLETFDSIKFISNPRNTLYQLQILLWQGKFDVQAHSYTLEQTETMNLGLDCQEILSDLGICGANEACMTKGINNAYLAWKFLESYSTSHYSYLIAEVYARDIYNHAFAKDPLNEKQGRRFRQIVLEHREAVWSPNEEWQMRNDPYRYLIHVLKLWVTGRSETTMGALEKFMGRPLSDKAFVKALREGSEQEDERSSSNKFREIWARFRARI
ncbi:uncharacterized protein RSE6_02219 [Rhynchosporium secalis]|uniref:Peptidase M3A/M3B catalytic domain-containing protein n=1 Tax=Rhynchosporium secalis TaxID=38038 RepID=A0A1E1LZR7_RHYSE|nr:uncharacterized protein RSE6_02219 [Rhynchosporium secalis]